MGRHRSKSRSRSRTPVTNRLLKLANMDAFADKIRSEKGKTKGDREWDKDKEHVAVRPNRPRSRSRSHSRGRNRDNDRKNTNASSSRKSGLLPGEGIIAKMKLCAGYPEESIRDARGRKSRSRSNSPEGKSKDRDRSKGHKSRKDSRSRGNGKEKASSSNGKHKDKKSKKSKSKKKKSRKRTPSSSSEESDSSISSADSVVLLQRLEEERKKQKTEEKRRKEEMKALETPGEKRQRRLAKKETKERKRKERMGWDPEHLHYTNTDNPFGDHDLMGTFLWKKKLEKQGMTDLSKEEIERRNRLLADENKRELEKVKIRRLEKEKETQAREEEQQLIQRQKEAEQFQEWGKQEDVFHLEQARLRSKIRITDGRAKPIDLLAQYVSAEDEVDAIEMHEPYSYLNGLTIGDLEDLLEDIVVYKELEKGKNLSYWNDITVIVEDELRKLRKLEQDDDYRMAVERREGINSAVASDVSELLKGKTAEKLEELKISIQFKLDGSVHGLDISYWESLLSQLKAYIARARLRDRHQDNLKAKLEMLKTQQGVKMEDDSDHRDSPIPATSRTIQVDEKSEEPGPSDAPATKQENDEEEENEAVEEDEDDAEAFIVEESIRRYDIGGYSPKLITQEEIEPGIFVIGEDEDNVRLDLARSQVLKVGKKVENVWTAEEKALENEAKKGMTNDEAGFSVEAQVDNQLYLWSDKYRPRKPRYFNRVHTGFEWNKYNQTHYDMDNPPPKIVQGYKFNIFYPDLIDKNSTPRYSVTACADNPDFAILRFIAGPPYEDIAFKVVNREWEYSYKRGFRCQFQNNIFQLWYHFKRLRYRR